MKIFFEQESNYLISFEFCKSFETSRNNSKMKAILLLAIALAFCQASSVGRKCKSGCTGSGCCPDPVQVPGPRGPRGYPGLNLTCPTAVTEGYVLVTNSSGCGYTTKIRTNSTAVIIGDTSTNTIINGPNIDLTNVPTPPPGVTLQNILIDASTSQIYRDSANVTTALSTVIPFAGGTTPTITLFTVLLNSTVAFNSAFGGSSTPTLFLYSNITQLTETQFSWTAPRDGILRLLDVNFYGTVTAEDGVTPANVTVEFVLRTADPATSSGGANPFADTPLTASSTVTVEPASVTTIGGHVENSVSTFAVSKGDRVTLQTRLRCSGTSFSILVACPVAVDITLGVSAGVLF